MRRGAEHIARRLSEMGLGSASVTLEVDSEAREQSVVAEP